MRCTVAGVYYAGVRAHCSTHLADVVFPCVQVPFDAPAASAEDPDPTLNPKP